jgi:hypothetical protein
LTSGTPDNKSAEGALQIMQSYLGTLGTSSANVGLLACSDTSTPQGVVVCGTSTSAGQVVGVYDNNPSQLSTSPSVIPIRYGRPLVKNFGTPALWVSGDYVCRDTTNNGYAIDNSTIPCNRGTSVGVAAGDPTGLAASNSHAVDLVQEPIVQGGALVTFSCTGAVGGTSTMYLFPGSTNTACGAATANSVVQPVSFSGTVKNLEVFYGTAPGTGVSDKFTVLKCAGMVTPCVATSITCTVSGSGTPATCNDVTDAVSISIGDGIQIQDKAGTGGSSTAQQARASIEIQ